MTFSRKKHITSVLPKVTDELFLAAIQEITNDSASLINDNNFFKNYFSSLVKIKLLGYGLSIEADNLNEVFPQLSKANAIQLLFQINQTLATCEKEKYITEALSRGFDRLDPIMTREDFDALVKKMKVTNLAHLPNNKVYIFCVMGDTYYLKYGDNVGFDKIYGLQFYSDIGFVASGDKKTDLFVRELNSKFNAWKASGSVNDFMTQDHCDLLGDLQNHVMVQPTTSRVGLFSANVNATNTPTMDLQYNNSSHKI